MLVTESSERSTAVPCRRAASSSIRACSATALLVRCMFTVTRCT
jgi:hypothetical protein